MKLKNVTALLITATAGVMSLQAQQSAQAVPRLNAWVQLKTDKRTHSAITLVPSSTITKGVFAVQVNQVDPPREFSTKDCKVFFVVTPNELVTATRSYDEGSLKDARRQLSAVRAKYAPFVGLPGNPAHKAALMELDCLARMQDWSALAKLADAFPGAQFLDADDKLRLDVARILSKVSEPASTAADRLKEVDAFLGDESKMRRINSSSYSWLKYAQGCALAAGIPADQLKSGIAEANVAKASLAVDAFCEAAMATHGRDLELPVAAMRRAFGLLWAMPGVQEYAEAKGRKMDRAVWEGADHNFRDAVALAYMLQHVFAPELKDEAVSKAAALYFNARETAK